MLKGINILKLLYVMKTNEEIKWFVFIFTLGFMTDFKVDLSDFERLSRHSHGKNYILLEIEAKYYLSIQWN